AALFARLDEDHAARVRHARRLQRLDGGERGERRVAVVPDAAPEEALALARRDPWAEALGPADHLRLLVAVTVEEDGVVARARHVDEDDGRAAGQPRHVEREAFDRALRAPVLE